MMSVFLEATKNLMPYSTWQHMHHLTNTCCIPLKHCRLSALGTQNIAELARKNDAPLLFASTSEVYGDAEIVPTPESYWGKVNPIGPRSCYDEGKRFAEALLMAYSKQYGLDVRLPRIFNSYGPRLREDGFMAEPFPVLSHRRLRKSP